MLELAKLKSHSLQAIYRLRQTEIVDQPVSENMISQEGVMHCRCIVGNPSFIRLQKS